ncbi:MAG: flavodoxin domain-containing protein [Filifactoraceae bacterium]
MKSIVIYSSQTGFTEKYAKCLADRLAGQAMDIKEAKKKEDSFFESFDALVYGGVGYGRKNKQVRMVYR